MEEIWTDVKGYEGLYMISSHGKVWSCRNKVTMKPGKGSNGYNHVTLLKNNERKTITIHRLVAINFIPKIKNKVFINHINENKLDNNVENLEWCTQIENLTHGSRIKRITDKKSLKIVGVNIVDGSTIHFPSMKEAKRNGFNNICISRCIKGEHKTHKGYKWYKQSDFEQKENKQCM